MAKLRDKEKRNQIRHDLEARLTSGGVPVAEVCKGLRKMLAKDQAEFCAMVGISLSTLRKIEQGRGHVSLATLDKVLAPFELSLVVVRQAAASN